MYLKLSEVAKILNLSVSAMYALCKSKDFPALKFPAGKSFTYRVNKVDFEKWIKQNSNLKGV